MTPVEITSFITGHTWKFARTMPEHPHWYVVKEKCRSQAEFARLVIHIREHGYKEKYGGRWYTVFAFSVGDTGELPWREPCKMWTMSWPVEQTVIINAKPLSYDQ